MIKAEDGFDVRSRPPGIQTETLMICGAKDGFWPLEMFAETAVAQLGIHDLPPTSVWMASRRLFSLATAVLAVPVIATSLRSVAS